VGVRREVSRGTIGGGDGVEMNRQFYYITTHKDNTNVTRRERRNKGFEFHRK